MCRDKWTRVDRTTGVVLPKASLNVLHGAVTTLVLGGQPRVRGRGRHDISHFVLSRVDPAMSCFTSSVGTPDWAGLVLSVLGIGSGAQI